MEKIITIEKDDTVLFKINPSPNTISFLGKTKGKYTNHYVVKVLCKVSAYSPNDPHMFSGYSDEGGVDDNCWRPYLKKNYGKVGITNIKDLMLAYPEDFI